MKGIWKKYLIISGLFGLAGMVGSLIYFGYMEIFENRDNILHQKKYAYHFNGRTMNPALIVNDQESAYKLVGYYDRNDLILPFSGSDFNTIPVGNEVEVLGYSEDSLIANIKTHKDRGGMDSEMTGYVYSKTLHDYLKEFDKDMLIGIWAEDEESNAIFQLTSDSVYYVEHLDTPYKYDLIGDSLIFLIEGENYPSNIVKLTNDSLILFEQLSQDTLKLYKRK